MVKSWILIILSNAWSYTKIKYVCILCKLYHTRYMLLNIQCKLKRKHDDSIMMLFRCLFFFLVDSEWKFRSISWPQYHFHSSSILFIQVHIIHPILLKQLSYFTHHLLLPSITRVSAYAFLVCRAAPEFLHAAEFTQLQCWLEMSCLLSCCETVSCHFLCCQLI